MKNFTVVKRLLSFSLALLAGSINSPAAAETKENKMTIQLPTQLKSFFVAKEQQARALADELHIQVAPEIWSYFAAAHKGDWLTVSNLFESLRKRNSQSEGSNHDPTVRSAVWPTLLEIQLAYEGFTQGETKYIELFAQEIITSIPPGSIYFGGTDPGRGLVTAFCKSQVQGDPFFTLTQNALADNRYLDYLRRMYGGKVYTPSPEDSRKCFESYIEDAQKRLAANQLKPGEDVKIVGDRVQVSGQVAVMAINGLLAKIIFDQNSNRAFFIEESFPLDWMYPHLSPHGLIMKIHRQPLKELPEDVVRQDHEYWRRQVMGMIGDWLDDQTTVKDVCLFAEKVFLQKNLDGFKGDARFVKNENACKMFSKLRSAIAGIYTWRLGQTTALSEKARLLKEADLAFRQALALCPYSPEAVFRYVNLLVEQKRWADAIAVVQTATKLDPKNATLSTLLKELKKKQADAQSI